MHSIVRDDNGRLVPVVRPKSWLAASVKRSRDRTDRIARARKQRKARLATAQWSNALDRRGIAELEATGIPWAAVQRWLDEVRPARGFHEPTVLEAGPAGAVGRSGIATGAVRGPARALPAADRRPHCRLRSHAADPSQHRRRCTKNPSVRSPKTPRISRPIFADFTVSQTAVYGTARPA